ncbi:hypothetical protein GRAN_0127 [Granulicella sibirica]|uniref:Uncharacterized protein n=1 Tax=Granulicella sibirica TaxID=2479048 RepID=A0A4Q0T0Z7_9BACT|nr:hypothetical protein GRAN_0127 [Granulicella sibirica]
MRDGANIHPVGIALFWFSRAFGRRFFWHKVFAGMRLQHSAKHCHHNRYAG